MPRISLDTVMMACAHALSHRATCRKRAVGCVLTDSHGHILSTGYNGVAAGALHCTDHPCGGENMPAGSDTCQAVHAELNALLRCKDVREIDTCYVTVFPCNNCMKTLLNTTCRRIVLCENSHGAGGSFAKWIEAGREVEYVAKTSFAQCFSAELNDRCDVI